MAIWDTGRVYVSLVALRAELPFAGILGVALAVTGFPMGEGQRRAFFAAAGMAAAYIIVAVVLASIGSIPASAIEKEKQAWIAPSNLVVPAVRSITACLIRHRSLHPDHRFPRSLDAMAAASNCDRESLKPGHVKDYWTFYDPVEGVGGRITILTFSRCRPRPPQEMPDSTATL